MLIFLWLGVIGLPFLLFFALLLSVFAGHNETIILSSLGTFYISYLVICISVTLKRKTALRSVPLVLRLAKIAMICSIMGYFGYLGYVEYHRSIPQVQGEVDLYYYRPFEEDSDRNRLAKLDTAANFKVSGNIPRIDGATGLYPLYAAIAQAVYPKMDYYPHYLPDGVESLVRCSKTPQAYENLIDGKVDVIFVAGPSDKQLALAKEKGVELKLTPIGKEAFVFFVNAENKLDNLSVEQIRQIYAGKITNWREVGGNNDSIRAFQRPEGSGSQTALQRIMGDIPLMQAPREDVPAGMGGIINRVANYRNYKNGLGYSFLFFATQMVDNKEIKLLSIDGVAANHDNIRSGKYPFAKAFYAVTTQHETEETRKLIDWITSAQGKELIRKSGFVPVE